MTAQIIRFPGQRPLARIDWAKAAGFYGSILGAWLIIGTPVYCLLAFFHFVPWWA